MSLPSSHPPLFFFFLLDLHFFPLLRASISSGNFQRRNANERSVETDAFLPSPRSIAFTRSSAPEVWSPLHPTESLSSDVNLPSEDLGKLLENDQVRSDSSFLRPLVSFRLVFSTDLWSLAVR